MVISRTSKEDVLAAFRRTELLAAARKVFGNKGFEQATVEAIAEEYDGKAGVYKMNVDENINVPQQFGIRGIPTLIVFKSGKEQEAGFYYSAASFYLDQNKDLPQALKWVDQAIEKNPKAYFMQYKKAQILAKMGNKKEASAAAEKSIELLKASPNPDESAIANSKALIDSLR